VTLDRQQNLHMLAQPFRKMTECWFGDPALNHIFACIRSVLEGFPIFAFKLGVALGTYLIVL
jgi:hypothetical protein